MTLRNYKARLLTAAMLTAAIFCAFAQYVAADDTTVKSTSETAAARRPNFVFFLVDDLGWADVGCNGSTFHETPNIDRLASSGMRFTNGYAACPVCSPTRASIMTGRHPVRVDITDWIAGRSWRSVKDARLITPEDRSNLALEEITIAELLKQYDYQTFFAGKWHLGPEGHFPEDQGFDINIGGCQVGSPPGGYYSPWKNPRLTANEQGEYVTHRLTAESIDFMKNRNSNQPFLLYLAYYNVHTPITACKDNIEKFEAKAEKLFTDEIPPIIEHDALTRPRQDNPALASMVGAVDDSVGLVLKAIRQLGLEDDTIVFFFSDNGGLSTLGRVGPTSNAPLRAGKGWLYEGGIREPMIVRVPGMTQPGSVCDTPVVSTDFFPTMLDLAGLPLRNDLHADGTSIVPLLEGDKAFTPHDAIYWHYPHYHGSNWKPGAAIRDGDWKLIEFYHYEKVELYNLADDPYEQDDLSKKQPVKTQQLLDKLHVWQKEIGAKMPVPNPAYQK